MEDIALVRPLLLIVPGYGLAEDVQVEVAVVEFEVIFGLADFTNEVFGILQCRRCSEKELVVILIKNIYVVGAGEAAVHDQLGFAVSEYVELADKFSYGLDVRDVPGELPVVERKTRLFAKQYSEIDLRQMLSVLVLAVLITH